MDFVEVDVEAGANCDLSVTRMFERLGEPREVRWVESAFRLDGWEGPCDVVGWTEGKPSPALAVEVSDSGEGMVVLVYGGDEGVRLRPAATAGPWSLDDVQQWGEPCLLLDPSAEVR